MQITGEMLIGSKAVRGTDGEVWAINPATGEALEARFFGGDAGNVDQACRLATAAFDIFRATTLEVRAQFLEAIAQGIIDLGDLLIERVMAESGLTRARLEGERGRTCGQLRLFASIVREGRWLNVVVDTALPERKPLPRPDLRSRKIPLGPVAVFGASNFPLAFSVGGGDTASAFAAGCPVIAKSHPSHLGTSELVGRVIQSAVADCGLPEGTFSLIFGKDNAVGEALVKNPAIQAVAFTGSRRGGLALGVMASQRRQPIPVFAEMSSTNPVFLFPGALAQRGDVIAKGLIDSATLGVGQFCTKPGFVIGVESPEFIVFADKAGAVLQTSPAGTMLNAGIQQAYETGTKTLQGISSVEMVAAGSSAAGPSSSQAMLFSTSAKSFLSNPKLADEVFGPATLIVSCKDESEMLEIAEGLEGQLTATLHLDDADMPAAHRLLPILERKVGRILINGFPTGVEVAHAMVHGGPFPSTTDSRATSVGGMAIERFLRPVCYQNFPDALLPDALKEANPLSFSRVVDGKLQLS